MRACSESIDRWRSGVCGSIDSASTSFSSSATGSSNSSVSGGILPSTIPAGADRAGHTPWLPSCPRSSDPDFLNLAAGPFGRPEADLRFGIHLDAQGAVRVLQLDIERHAPVPLVLRKDVPQPFEGRPIV